MKRNQFGHSPLPYLLIAPQLLIILIFFVWPAVQSVRLSFFLEDPWGLSRSFVGFDNYTSVLSNSQYHSTALFTLFFSAVVTVLALGVALLLAVKADGIIRGAKTYRVLLIWAYAVAPAVAGMIGLFLANQHIGPLFPLFNLLWDFDNKTDSADATFWLTLVCVWKQVSVNFVYFLAGLQGIPRSVREAAALDCQSGFRRFWTVTFPLLAPTGFFLMVINITYAFFDTFPIIDTLTRGRPGGSTFTLVYKVYKDGFLGADLGGSSAQSVILMVVVMLLTIVQFRFIERKIHY
ncbi:MAG: ABC transporter permease subunit [Rhodospirillum sp.]|nr:ABC transporter permease subunit [Rhodospirillum sp.]MCF8488344.1 ABC transporter permease subunit [Rhodospirillum sp.]MCF8502623.1 ABC transporter permease subunit [Rhodospirillum sp.]